MKTTTLNRTRRICEAALIAAIYVLLTQLASMLGIGSGVIQIRFSEALSVLAVFTPAAVPGVTLGCLIANIVTACAPWDIVFGTLASLVGMLGARALKDHPYLAPLPYAAANIIAVPLILALVYSAEESLPFLYLTVGIGEIISVYALGIPLYFALNKHRKNIFVQ